MFNIPPKLQKSRWRYVIGIFLVVIGAAFLVLPIGPGTFFILLGLYIINAEWAIKKIHQFKVWWGKWTKKKKK